MARFFNGGDVGRLLHYADEFLIPGRTAAVDAGIDVGDVVADRAETQLGLDIANGGGESRRVIFARSEDMRGEALRALPPSSRQLFSFVDEPHHRFRKP